MRTDEFTHLAV